MHLYVRDVRLANRWMTLRVLKHACVPCVPHHHQDCGGPCMHEGLPELQNGEQQQHRAAGAA